MNKDQIFENEFNQLFIKLNASNKLDHTFNYYQAINTNEKYLQENIFYFEPELKQIDEINKQFESLFKLKPNEDNLLLLYLVFQGKVIQDTHKAKQIFNKIDKKSSVLYQANIYMGGVYFASNQYPEAKKHFENAIEINSSFIKPFFNIGILEFEQENYPQAIELFEIAKAKDPNVIDSYLKLIQIYEIQKKFQLMLDQINQALEKWGHHSFLNMKKRTAQKQLTLLSKKKTDDLFHVSFVPEVYDLLSLNYPGYKLIKQRLVMKEGKKADVMEIEFQGENKDVTFVYD